MKYEVGSLHAGTTLGLPKPTIPGTPRAIELNTALAIEPRSCPILAPTSLDRPGNCRPGLLFDLNHQDSGDSQEFCQVAGLHRTRQ